jgi:uncharacterized protein (DUF983 family)
MAEGGVSLPVVLTIVFVILKLTNVITWSWVWVLSPLWISFGLGIILFVILSILGISFYKGMNGRR